MRLTALAALLAGLLFSVGCDSNDPSDDAENALVRVHVTGVQGDPVDGLRVGVRPCFSAECNPEAIFSASPTERRSRSARHPVELDGSLTATLDGRDVVLSWKTTSEEDSEGFRIQRRAEGVERFSTVAFVESKGTGSTTETGASYRYRDRSLPFGTHTYRLVQVDLDGKRTTHDDHHAQATVLPEDNFSLEGPFPNPFRTLTSLRLAVRENQPINAIVQDLTGSHVTTLFEGTLSVGRHQFSYSPTADTPDGIYRIVVEGEAVSDTVYGVILRPQRPVYRSLGTTGSDGVVTTDERGYFPGLLDLPTQKRRSHGGALRGTFNVVRTVQIALTDPATGRQQTYRRTVQPDENAFDLNWTP